MPATESLKDTIARVLPYWEARIAPALGPASACWSPRTAIRCAPWSSIFREFPDDDIPALEIPTGEPIVYELDGDLREIEHYYLKDRSE